MGCSQSTAVEVAHVEGHALATQARLSVSQPTASENGHFHASSQQNVPRKWLFIDSSSLFLGGFDSLRYPSAYRRRRTCFALGRERRRL